MVAHVAHTRRHGLGDLAQYGMGADRGVASLDLGVGPAPPAEGVAVAHAPAFGGPEGRACVKPGLLAV
jgi:hypothetical protein